jgi:hypothetical protein
MAFLDWDRVLQRNSLSVSLEKAHATALGDSTEIRKCRTYPLLVDSATVSLETLTHRACQQTAQVPGERRSRFEKLLKNGK